MAQRCAVTDERPVGVVTHYWSRIGVAGVHLDAPIDVGDHIHVCGHSDDFEQDVRSLEFDHHQLMHAEAGSDIAIQTTAQAHVHDRVFKATAGTL